MTGYSGPAYGLPLLSRTLRRHPPRPAVLLRWFLQGCPRTLPVVVRRGTLKPNDRGGWTASGWAVDASLMRPGVVLDGGDLMAMLLKRYGVTP